MRRGFSAAGSVAAAAAIGAGAFCAAPAGAVPAVGCGSVSVNHATYAVRAHVLKCTLARGWTVAFLAHGKVPAGYDCQRYSPKVTRVRFLCDNPATVTRIDGPLSFSASR